MEDIALSERKITDLIEAYRLAWNARDFEKMASFFSEPATYIVPGGNLHIPDKAALISKLRQQFVELEAEDFDHTEIGEVVVTLCNEHTALAELRNLRRLNSNGVEIAAIDALYICVLEKGSWRLSVAMAGQCGWNEKSRLPVSA
jgi:ketosteroid isomerase-like protein